MHKIKLFGINNVEQYHVCDISIQSDRQEFVLSMKVHKKHTQTHKHLVVVIKQFITNLISRSMTQQE